MKGNLSLLRSTSYLPLTMACYFSPVAEQLALKAFSSYFSPLNISQRHGKSLTKPNALQKFGKLYIISLKEQHFLTKIIGLIRNLNAELRVSYCWLYLYSEYFLFKNIQCAPHSTLVNTAFRWVIILWRTTILLKNKNDQKLSKKFLLIFLDMKIFSSPRKSNSLILEGCFFFACIGKLKTKIVSSFEKQSYFWNLNLKIIIFWKGPNQDFQKGSGEGRRGQ